MVSKQFRCISKLQKSICRWERERERNAGKLRWKLKLVNWTDVGCSSSTMVVAEPISKLVCYRIGVNLRYSATQTRTFSIIFLRILLSRNHIWNDSIQVYSGNLISQQVLWHCHREFFVHKKNRQHLQIGERETFRRFSWICELSSLHNSVYCHVPAPLPSSSSSPSSPSHRLKRMNLKSNSHVVAGALCCHTISFSSSSSSSASFDSFRLNL